MDEESLISRFHEQIALIDGDANDTLTYHQLQDRVELFLNHIGAEKCLIFLFCSNSIETIVAYLAAMHARHAVCLLDANAQPEFKQRLVEAYSPLYVFDNVSDVHFEGYDRFATIYPGMHAWKLRNAERHPALHPRLQLLLSTSGTTGSPKLIRLTKENLISNARSIASYLGIGPGERAVASLPFHYSYGLSVLNSHLYAGGAIVLTKQSVVQKAFWDLFDRYGCTSFAGVPYTYQMLHRIGFQKMPLPSLKTATQAGGKLSNELVAAFHEGMAERQGRFFVMYGQTEATARIAYLDPKHLPQKAGAIGQAIPGGLLTIWNQDRLVETPHAFGELVYQGENVMLGYAARAADLARGDDTHGVLRTGDLGCFDEDGIFFVTGRLKRISKIYGYRISLDEVEDRLRLHGAAAVTGNDDKIIIHMEKSTYVNAETCVMELAKTYHLHPSSFECRLIDKLPLTPSGKIDYILLQERT